MRVAATTAIRIGVRNCICFLMKTLSSRYFVEAGRTSPESRLMTIRPKPSARIPRRGRSSSQTSGNIFQETFAFEGFSWAPVLFLAAMAAIRPPSLVVVRREIFTDIPLVIRGLGQWFDSGIFRQGGGRYQPWIAFSNSVGERGIGRLKRKRGSQWLLGNTKCL